MFISFGVITNTQMEKQTNKHTMNKRNPTVAEVIKTHKCSLSFLKYLVFYDFRVGGGGGGGGTLLKYTIVVSFTFIYLHLFCLRKINIELFCLLLIKNNR